MRKKYSLIVAGLLFLAQLFVPWQMIREQLKVEVTAKEFRFKIDSRNNYDFSLQGRLLFLNFEKDSLMVQDSLFYEGVSHVYIVFENGPDGEAAIKSVNKEKPSDGKDWLLCSIFKIGNRVDSTNTYQYTSYRINYPFNRYYINESKYDSIASNLGKALSDTTRSALLVVRIQENQFIQKTILVDGKPIL